MSETHKQWSAGPFSSLLSTHTVLLNNNDVLLQLLSGNALKCSLSTEILLINFNFLRINIVADFPQYEINYIHGLYSAFMQSLIKC